MGLKGTSRRGQLHHKPRQIGTAIIDRFNQSLLTGYIRESKFSRGTFHDYNFHEHVIACDIIIRHTLPWPVRFIIYFMIGSLSREPCENVFFVKIPALWYKVMLNVAYR